LKIWQVENLLELEEGPAMPDYRKFAGWNAADLAAPGVRFSKTVARSTDRITSDMGRTTLASRFLAE